MYSYVYRAIILYIHTVDSVSNLLDEFRGHCLPNRGQSVCFSFRELILRDGVPITCADEGIEGLVFVRLK